MLSKPVYGWSDFHLENTSVYSLSYLDDLAFVWIEQAIGGLETMRPFCVKAFMEPNRFLCLVSYWNCHIICEDDERGPLGDGDVKTECSHTNMLQFCEFLYRDVRQNIEEWVEFADGVEKSDYSRRRERLDGMLERLKELISERRECFGEHRCFL